MGVRTTADEKIEEAKEHLAKAYAALLVVLDEETWWHRDYTADYIDNVQNVNAEIMKLKRKL